MLIVGMFSRLPNAIVSIKFHGGYTLCDTCGARTTPIPSQRARALPVGKIFVI